MNYTRIEEHIAQVYADVPEDQMPFHHWGLIAEMLHSIDKLTEAENIHPEDLVLLKTAVLFAFIGHLNEQDTEKRIQSSLNKAEVLLGDYSYKPEEIEKVKQLIRNFFSDKEPSTLPDKIFKDAYYAYLGSDGYYTDIHNLKRELERNGIDYPIREWYQKELDFLQGHRFYTSKAATLYDDKKQIQISEIKKLLGVA